jgi:hypothetical protein
MLALDYSCTLLVSCYSSLKFFTVFVSSRFDSYSRTRFKSRKLSGIVYLELAFRGIWFFLPLLCEIYSIIFYF